MKKLKFRAKDDEGNWNYGEGGEGLSSFFAGIGGGQLNSDTLEQLKEPSKVDLYGEYWEKVKLC